jgi:predicted nucleic acid-binding protein
MEYDVGSALVLQFVASSGASAYDCEFVALATDLGVAFVTVDRQLPRDFPATAPALDEFVA